MRTSNRVRRNISLALLAVGIACIAARGWQVAADPSSAKAWFKLCGIIFLTYTCFERFRLLQRRVRKGILYGEQ